MVAARMAAQAFLYKDILGIDACDLAELFPGAKTWNQDLLEHKVGHIAGSQSHIDVAF